MILPGQCALKFCPQGVAKSGLLSNLHPPNVSTAKGYEQNVSSDCDRPPDILCSSAPPSNELHNAFQSVCGCTVLDVIVLYLAHA